jgi:hypothetical protein
VKRQDDAPRARKIIDKIGVIERERRSLGNGVSAKVPRFSCNNIRAINVVISIAVAINHGAGAALRSLGNGVSAKVPRFSCNNIRAINVVISIAVAINHGAGAALRTIDRDGAGVIDQILSLTDSVPSIVMVQVLSIKFSVSQITLSKGPDLYVVQPL